MTPGMFMWGQATPASGFDASGLVVWAYGREGFALPHYPVALWNLGRHLTGNQLRVGDLVFFNGHSHVGIYIGHNKFVHAAHPAVRVDSSLKRFWEQRFDGAVRLAHL